MTPIHFKNEDCTAWRPPEPFVFQESQITSVSPWFSRENWNVFICFFIVFYHKSNFFDINEKKMIPQ